VGSSLTLLESNSSGLILVCLLFGLFSLDSIASLLELSGYLLLSGHGSSLHPGVANNICHGKTLARDQLEHTSQHISELLGEAIRFVTSVRAPEHVSTVPRDELVETIRRQSVSERRMAGNHDEQNDSCSE